MNTHYEELQLSPSLIILWKPNSGADGFLYLPHDQVLAIDVDWTEPDGTIHLHTKSLGVLDVQYKGTGDAGLECVEAATTLSEALWGERS